MVTKKKVSKSPKTLRNIEKFDIKKQKKQEPSLTLDDAPDSWDEDQEPKMVPMYSQWPYQKDGPGFVLW